MSLPLWERGLKCTLVSGEPRIVTVAPFVGAWVEITKLLTVYEPTKSLPLWERGLKFQLFRPIPDSLLSLPLWERGLK